MSFSTRILLTLALVTVGCNSDPSDEPGIRILGAGPGTGKVTSTPTGINCTVDHDTKCENSFPLGTAVTLSAQANPGSAFIGWEGADCSGVDPCTITVEQKAAIVVTARFNLGARITLTTPSNGSGEVVSTPAGLACSFIAGTPALGSDCSAVFPIGQSVQLTATPADSNLFLGWTGIAAACPPSGLTCAVTVDASSSVSINFVLPFRAAQVSAGPNHTCALKDNQIYCWGNNDFGILGVGYSGGTLEKPTLVSGGYRFNALSAGGARLGDAVAEQTCGIRTDGVTMCWGWNNFGQLGTGDSVSRSSPRAVNTAVVFTRISVGGDHVCGLTGSGEAYCWGRNYSGQLGTGDFDQHPVPAPVVGGLTFASIAAGQYHTCGLTFAGTAYCWGNGPVGEIGNGQTGIWTNTPQQAQGGPFNRIAAGYFVSCGVTAANQAYCWGNNQAYMFGDGSEQDRSTPSPAAGGSGVVQLAMGAHGCAVQAVNLDVLCWGRNSRGQLGDGTVTSRPSPVAVMSQSMRFTGLSVGGPYRVAGPQAGDSISSAHTCAIGPTSSVFCWGANDFGQLGTADSEDRLVPSAVIP